MGDDDYIYSLLDNLGKADFKRFKPHLKSETLPVPGYRPIPWGRLEKADVTDIVQLMKERYGVEGRMAITQHILEVMGLWVPQKDTNQTVSGAGAGTGGGSKTEAEVFVDMHSHELISRVSSVMAIADVLHAKKLIPNEKYSEIKAAGTKEGKMRVMYDCLNAAGAKGKADFYEILKDKEPYLFDDLSKTKPE